MNKGLETAKYNDLKRLERAEEIAKFGHWEFKLDTGEVTGSKGAWKIYGLENLNPTITEIQELPLKEYRQYLDEKLKALIENNEPYDVEFRIRRPDDNRIVDIHSVAEYDPGRNIVFGVIQDVTDRKTTERQLQKQEQDYKFITENTSDVIWTMDKNGMILYVSPSVYKFRGYHPEEIIGKSFTEVLTPGSAQTAQNILKDFVNKLKSGDPQKTYVRETFEQFTKDGSIVWNESVISPLYDENDQFKMFIGVSRNITDRYNTEQALIKREQELMTAIETTGLGLWDLDFTTDTLTRNDNWYKMLGYSKSDLKDGIQGWKDLIHPEDLEMAVEKADAHEKGKSDFFSVEHRLKSKSGKWVWVHNWGKIINRDEHGNPLRAIGVHLDITHQKIAEKELEERKQKYESLYNNIPVALFRSTPSGKIISCNQKAADIYGFNSLEEFISRPAQDFYQDQDKREFMLESVRKNGQLKSFITKEYKKDGSDIWVKADYQGIFDEKNNLIYIDGVAEDFTFRKKAEDALIESEERYRLLVENSPDGIFILKEDKIAYINESGVRMFGGKSKEQFLGLSFEKLLKKENSIESQERITNLITGTFSKYPVEDTFVTLKGREIPVEIHASLIDYQGSKAIQKIIRDNTERIKAQSALRESEAKYRTIAENFPNGIIFIVDREGKYIFAEGQGINQMGFDKDSFIGKTYHQVFPEHIVESIDGITAEVQMGKQGYFEVEMSGRYFANTVVPVMDEENNLDQLIIITIDISDRKKAEKLEKEMFAKLEDEVAKRIKELNEQAARLKESQKALTFLLEDVNDARNELLQANKNLEAANNDLEAFAYSVSHDLRAPLRHIDGFSQMLENLIRDRTPDIEKYFIKIHEASGRMHNLINDLLTFSRLGRKKLRIMNIDLRHLIEEVIKNYEPDLAHREVEWKIGELPQIRADYEMFKVVMDNLISNAIKFTSKKKHAVIEIVYRKPDDKNFEIIIRDNGVGFDNEYAHKMFGVFERLHNDEEFPGTGIGLANVKRIIRSHKGDIRGEGKIGEGATFFINLPIKL